MTVVNGDGMDTLTWVILTNALVWVGLGAYLAFLASRQKALAARLAQWELLHHE